MEVTRRRLLAAAAGAGAATAGAFAIARGGSSPAPGRAAPVLRHGATARTTDRFGLGDAGIANFLLTVQRVELELYRHALRSGAPRGRLKATFEELEAQESLHVVRLERTVADLGTHTVRPPRVDAPLTSGAGFLQFATTVEGIAAGACLGQVPAIDTRAVLEAVLAIGAVDARHASALNLAAGIDPSPDGALAQPIDAADALTRLRPILRR